MTKPVATFLLGLGLLAFAGCGRKGPLVVPPGRAPMPVESLKAVPANDAVLLTWTNPLKDVSGRPLEPLAAVEIWVYDKGLPAADRPLTADLVEKTARLVRKVPRQEFGTLAGTAGEGMGAMTFSFPLPAQAARPAKLAFTVRVIDRKGRASDFSAPAAVELPRKDPAIARPDAGGASR